MDPILELGLTVYTPSSEKERLFIERWLQQEDSLNEHWLWNFRNVLSGALGLNALGKIIHTSSIFRI